MEKSIILRVCLVERMEVLGPCKADITRVISRWADKIGFMDSLTGE